MKHSSLTTTGDGCECWHQGAVARFPPKPTEIFVDFVPKDSRADFDVEVPCVRPTTLLATLRGTHAWTFKLLDTWRKEMVGADGVTDSWLLFGLGFGNPLTYWRSSYL